MMSALYIDCISRPNNSLLVAGPRVAMQATGGDDSTIKCHYCGNPGQRQKKLCRLDSGPVQRLKSANDSFNTVRALEKESRRRWQVDMVLFPQVHHAQRRNMPQATTANGQRR